MSSGPSGGAGGPLSRQGLKVTTIEHEAEGKSASWRQVRPLIAAVVLGVALGAMSLLADGVIRSRPLTLLGNLASPWVLTAFLVGLLTTSRRGGALAGGVAVVAGVATYYWAWVAGSYSLNLRVAAWAVAALTIGPLMGLCGALTARRRERPPLTAVTAPSAIVLAEAMFFVVERRVWLWDFAVHPHRLVDLSVLLALSAIGLILPARLLRPRRRLRILYPVVLVAGIVGAVGLFLAYGLLVGLPAG